MKPRKEGSNSGSAFRESRPSAASGADSRRLLVFGALCLVGVGILEVAVDQARRSGLVSPLAGDFTQYAAAFLVALGLIRTVAGVVGVRAVRNLLVAALLLFFVAGVLHVTNHIHALRAWPLLGMESRLNALIGQACGIASIVLTLFALVFAILSLKKTRDALLREPEGSPAEAAEELDRVFALSQDLIGVGGMDGSFRYVNPALEQMLGHSMQELLSRSFFEFVDPDDRERTDAEVARLSQGQITVDFENRYVCKDGSIRHILWSATPSPDRRTIYCIGRDITDRKRAEEALLEREGMYRMLIEFTNSFVFVLDATGVFQFVNRFWTQRAGYSAEEIVGTNGFDLILPESREAVRERLPEVLRGSLVEDIEFRSRTKDEGFIDVLVNLAPIRDSSGEVSQILGTGIDITERKQAEEERGQLEEQYRQVQKMEAIGQLTGGVAHDFNNLLQVINAGTDLAMQDLEAGHRARESLVDVAKAGERAARLVSQLLLFSRRQIMRPELLDLNEIVANLLQMLRRVIGEHIQLQWRPGTHVGTIHADRGMIEQALMNLCINARDAMPEGGTLTIETQEALLDEAYCAAQSGARPGRYALLIVDDTGGGMDEETLEHIFEPFFTTKEIDKGTGLGLATVYGIVKQHEGVIHALSEPRRGTTFKLYWPCSVAEGKVSESSIESSVRGGAETILLAEDDEMVQLVARTILERAGYTVLVARDGAEAVAYLEERGEDVEMAILDVVMPKMGGREAYEQIRGLCPDLKFLFATGYSADAVHTNFVLDQGLSLIQKPFSRDTLLRAVRKTLDQPGE